MASPVIEARTESAETTGTSSHTVSRPTGVSGRLTIVIFGYADAQTVTWPNGYTQFFLQDRSTDLGVVGAYHQDDGTEGTSITVTTDANTASAHHAYQLSGAENPSTQAPEATTVDGSTATTNPDPPSITPTGGSKDYTFIAGFNQDGEEADDDSWCNSAPSSYTNLVQVTTGVAGQAIRNCSHAAADRALTASTENPGTFNTDLSKVYVGYTIAVHPAGAAPPSAPAIGRVHLRGTASPTASIAAQGRAHLRGTASPTAIAPAATGRLHLRGTATGAPPGAIPNAAGTGRLHIRGTATGFKVASAPAIGRIHARGTATGLKIGLGSAVGRLHVRGTADGAPPSAIPGAPGVGRVHLRGTAVGTKIGLASAIGRSHVRGTASGLKVGLGSAVAHLHVRGTATPAPKGLGQAVGRLHVRGTASSVPVGAAGPVKGPTGASSVTSRNLATVGTTRNSAEVL